MTQPGARYTDRVVVVTGGGNGLGLAYARGFAAEGASVVVADIDGATARDGAAAIMAAGGRALAAEVDVADEASVAAMVRDAESAFGGIDVLVNNAGLHLGRYNECSTLPVADWRRIFDVNVLGAVLCARECRVSMAGRGGVILNQASVAAWSNAAGAYGATKLALTSVTMSLATEFAPDGIRVIAIAPGAFMSEAVQAGLLPEQREIVLAGQLTRDLGVPDDLVPMVLFLCSHEARFANAATYTYDAGFTKRI
ncbi:MAG TPA: SDR family oxidoreductase [Acidimicrobiia bacterium]|nr:SDR family oxidoreductase [Acidimicrobiia bacterium]